MAWPNGRTTIKELNARMNIPNKISGIKKEDIPLMASYAEKEANLLYPVPKLMNKKQLKKLLSNCRLEESI